MIGKLGTHSLRYSYRSWLDALGTPLRCSKNPCGMQASGVRTAFNIYEDAVTKPSQIRWLRAGRILCLSFPPSALYGLRASGLKCSPDFTLPFLLLNFRSLAGFAGTSGGRDLLARKGNTSPGCWPAHRRLFPFRHF